MKDYSSAQRLTGNKKINTPPQPNPLNRYQLPKKNATSEPHSHVLEYNYKFIKFDRLSGIPSYTSHKVISCAFEDVWNDQFTLDLARLYRIKKPTPTTLICKSLPAQHKTVTPFMGFSESQSRLHENTGEGRESTLCKALALHQQGI